MCVWRLFIESSGRDKRCHIFAQIHFGNVWIYVISKNVKTYLYMYDLVSHSLALRFNNPYRRKKSVIILKLMLRKFIHLLIVYVNSCQWKQKKGWQGVLSNLSSFDDLIYIHVNIESFTSFDQFLKTCCPSFSHFHFDRKWKPNHKHKVFLDVKCW